MAPQQTYKVYAIKYGRHKFSAPLHFIGGDVHDGPTSLDYFVWALESAGKTWIVDTGFDQVGADKRGREITRPVQDGLRAIGIDPASVQDVILTHMHYDHAGNRDLFPLARYHVQDREMSFCTGRCMCHKVLNTHFEPEDVSSMVHKIFKGRVEFHNGDAEIAPGLSVHRIGGHTDGLQVVRVMTDKGWMVLASDASHFYANMEQQRLVSAAYNTADMLEGFRRIHALADASWLVIPGHDPKVLHRFHPATRELDGWIARLDAGLR